MGKGKRKGSVAGAASPRSATGENNGILGQSRRTETQHLSGHYYQHLPHGVTSPEMCDIHQR